MSERVLIIEDDSAMQELLRMTVNSGGYEAIIAGSAEEGMGIIGDQRPDLVLLDWMLPGISGPELLKRLRKDSSFGAIPVIMLTAKATEQNTVQGLESGADDYIAKPFSTKELLSRIKALLRRIGGHSGHSISIGQHLVINRAQHQVCYDDNRIPLGPTEFNLLSFFVQHPDRVYSREQILDHVWGRNAFIEERTVDVHIRRLRKALEEYGCDQMIKTVRSAGYMFSAREDT